MLVFRRNSSRRGTTPGAAAAFSGGFGRGWRRRTGLASARRQGDVGAAEKACDRRGGVGAQQPVGAAMANAYLGEAVESAQEVFPFRREAGVAGEIIEVLLHRKRQEGTKDMPADGGVGGMEDRPTTATSMFAAIAPANGSWPR